MSTVSTAPCPDLQVPLRIVISSAQEFSSHVLMLLDLLKPMIPAPDDEGAQAHEFLQHILNHTEFHQDDLIRQMKAIDSVSKGEAA